MLTNKQWAGVILLLLSVPLVVAYVLREQRRTPFEIMDARVSQLERGGALYLVSFEGKRVGTSRLSYERSGDVIYLQEDLDVSFSVPGGGEQHTAQRLFQVLDRQLRLQRFSFRMAGELGEGRVQNTVIEGQRTDSGTIALSLLTGGSREHREVDAPDDLIFGAGAWFRVLLAKGLSPGTQYSMSEFDPLTLSVRETSLEVLGVRSVTAADLALEDESNSGSPPGGTLKVFSLAQTSGGLRYETELAETGLPITMKLPLGLTLERATAADLASSQKADGELLRRGAPGAGEYAVLITRSAIQVGVHIQETESLRRLVVLPRGAVLPDGALGGVQHARGDTIEVLPGTIPARGGSGYVLGQSNLLVSEALKEHLVPEPYIESSHPEIVAMADSILAGETDPGEAVRLIAGHVHDFLEKQFSGSFPSAIEALRAGAGDCKEHTVLTVALLRAAGVPARVVSGLAYLEGSFYYHAWPEVWLNGDWVPVDPTFGEIPASAARLRLAVGTAGMGTVVALIGALDLDVVLAE